MVRGVPRSSREERRREGSQDGGPEGWRRCRLVLRDASGGLDPRVAVGRAATDRDVRGERREWEGSSED